MGKQNGLISLRAAAENAFAGVVAAAIVFFIASGALAMCAPGVLVA
jgi:hypothetical protein